jgi:hypothetical protein
LAQLHAVLQIVMNWEDCHLHEFTIGRRFYGLPDPDDFMSDRKVMHEGEVRLCDVIGRVGTQFSYLYDFGDDWEHDLLLEAIALPDEVLRYPRCVDGARQTPPEECGGPPGYQRYLEALSDSDEGPFDPEAFSVEAVNQRLVKKFRLSRPVKSRKGRA